MQRIVLTTLAAAAIAGGGYFLGTLEPKHTHHDDPIIIDNPEAFIAMLPDKNSHDKYLTGPVDSKLNKRKSSAGLSGRSKYSYIRLMGTDNDGTSAYPLSSTEVVVDFEDYSNANKIIAAGSLTLDYRAASQPDNGIVTFDSMDYDDTNGKLRWKKGKKQIGTERRGIEKRDENRMYRISKVTFVTTGGLTVAKRATGATAVRATLCVSSACQ